MNIPVLLTTKLSCFENYAHQKPGGLTLIPESGKVSFLEPIPVRALYGVGRVTEQILNQAGVSTVRDLQRYRGD